MMRARTMRHNGRLRPCLRFVWETWRAIARPNALPNSLALLPPAAPATGSAAMGNQPTDRGPQCPDYDA